MAELVAVVPPDVVNLAETLTTAVRAAEVIVFFVPAVIEWRRRHVWRDRIPGLVAAQQLQVEERAAFVVEGVQVCHGVPRARRTVTTWS